MRLHPHNYDGSILLAVSGGVDSVVMVHLMCRELLRPERMAVAHCNFHLRGEESDGDESFVRSYAQSLGLPFYVKHFDTKSYAQAHGISLEMAARELRYGWFSQLCAEEGFNGVCVAHNANDNAETLMLNLLRGTGLKGACAMSFDTANPFGTGRVYRPLLSATRAEIENYAREHSLLWRTDSTNLESDCKRNILRNKVFPLLSGINPSFISTLNRDIRNFSMAYEALQKEGTAETAMVTENDGQIRISIHAQDKKWQYDTAQLLSELGFNAASISSLMELLQSDRTLSGKHFTSDTHIAVTTNDEIVISPVSEVALFDASQILSNITIEEQEWQKDMSPVTAKGETLLDADKLGAYPRLRLWKEGDWLSPIGLRGKKKVSDALTELKYNLLEKQKAVVVQGEGSHVMAIVGERVDQKVKIDDKTRRVYRILLKKG